MLQDAQVDAVVVLFVPTVTATADEVAEAVDAATARAASEKPVLAVVLNADGIPRSLRHEDAHVAAFPYPESAARALGRLAERAEWLRQPHGVVPSLDGIDRDAAERVVERALEDGEDVWLSPADTRELLLAYGLPLVPERLAGDADEAVSAAEELGFPVVVKTAVPGAHKTELGGVALDLADAEAVRAAAERIGGPVIVQPMIEGGAELLAGVVQDAVFGPLVAFGPGGVFAELIGEAAFRIAPLTDRDAAELVAGGKAGRLVSGFRGAPAADGAALADLLLRLARLGEDVPAVAELDLNPVLALPDRCVAVDARVRVRARSPRLEPRPGSATLNVLVVNAGSTSLKLALVGEDGSAQAVASLEEMPAGVDAVGHRVVHGGERFLEPVLIDEAVMAELEAVSELAPLHNAAALEAIEAARQALPDVPHVAVFDTAFHATLPEEAATYPVPVRWRREFGVRRYGFQGLSVQWASEQVPVPRLVVCHLGGGSSVTAVLDGRSVDTTMGFTPLDGLPMATRSGSIDPGLVLYLLRDGHTTVEELEHALAARVGPARPLRALTARARARSRRGRRERPGTARPGDLRPPHRSAHCGGGGRARRGRRDRLHRRRGRALAAIAPTGLQPAGHSRSGSSTTHGTKRPTATARSRRPARRSASSSSPPARISSSHAPSAKPWPSRSPARAAPARGRGGRAPPASAGAASA